MSIRCGGGDIAGRTQIDTNTLNPAPDTIDKGGVKSQLKQWINDKIIPTPEVNEQSLVYFIFPPTTTQLTLGALKGDSDFCGYHFFDKFNPASDNPDVFFGIVSTKAAHDNNAPAKDFVRALSACVGHELGEMFTDRDGAGYISTACRNSDGTSNTCEIGDICEAKDTFDYQRTGSGQVWSIQQYWSGWDNSCIHGDSPVGIKRFLSAIDFDFQHEGLRSLGTSTINTQFLASKM